MICSPLELNEMQVGASGGSRREGDRNFVVGWV